MNDILFGNNNRPIIKKLSRRYFKASKSRNIIAIVPLFLQPSCSQRSSHWVPV